jgi:hypothetical protein
MMPTHISLDQLYKSQCKPPSDSQRNNNLTQIKVGARGKQNDSVTDLLRSIWLSSGHGSSNALEASRAPARRDGAGDVHRRRCGQQQGGGPAPDLSGKGVCKFADPNVVNGCFKSFGQGTKFTTNPRGRVDCCVTFQGNDCLCEMKKAWAADKKGTGAQNKVDCVRNRKC